MVVVWCEDLSGLLFVWIGMSDFDLFYDENCEYVWCLMVVGVFCEWVEVVGGYYGFYFLKLEVEVLW